MKQEEGENSSQIGTPCDFDGRTALRCILMALPVAALGGVALELANMHHAKEVSAESCTLHAIGAMVCTTIVLVTILLIGRLHFFSSIMGSVQGLLVTKQPTRPVSWIVGALIAGLMLGLISRYWPPLDRPYPGRETSDPDADAGRSHVRSSAIATPSDEDE